MRVRQLVADEPLVSALGDDRDGVRRDRQASGGRLEERLARWGATAGTAWVVPGGSGGGVVFPRLQP
jgi:hypothetical protein